MAEPTRDENKKLKKKLKNKINFRLFEQMFKKSQIIRQIQAQEIKKEKNYDSINQAISSVINKSQRNKVGQ